MATERGVSIRTDRKGRYNQNWTWLPMLPHYVYDYPTGASWRLRPGVRRMFSKMSPEELASYTEWRRNIVATLAQSRPQCD